jgi:hypothetical protein
LVPLPPNLTGDQPTRVRNLSVSALVDFLLDLLGDPRLLSLTAIIISWLAYRRTRPVADLQRQLAELQVGEHHERVEARSKARVRAVATTRPDKIVLVNAGAGPATNVSITFQNVPREILIGKSPLPLPVLEPGERFPLVAAFAMGCFPPFDATVRWTDPDGTSREESLIVHQ